MKSHYRTAAEWLADYAAEQTAARGPLETKSAAPTRKPSAFQQLMLRIDRRLVALEQRIAKLEPRPTKSLHYTTGRIVDHERTP